MRKRPGYTLLEVMLAIAIGLLLVAALYAAMDTHFRYMQSGRNAVAEAQLARGLLNRVATDVRLSLGLLPSTAGSSASSAGTGDAVEGSAAPGDAASEPAAAATTAPGRFSLGIQGDEFQITLFLSTVPRYGRAEADVQTGVTDLRLVTYYLVPEQGLARQESRLVTAAEQTEEAPPDILAEEVVELRFRYYDGNLSDWVTTWDGTTSGPPLAVEITVAIRPPMESNPFGGSSRPPQVYRRVVAIPAANLPESSASGQTGATGGSP